MESETVYENKLRPSKLDEFIGQSESIKKIKIAVQAAKQRDESVDHILIGGSAGFGKTSLSALISKSYGSYMHIVNCASVKNEGDISRVLCKLNRHDFLFLDEIHGLNKKSQEILYPALEDFVLQAKSPETGELVQIPLPTFTVLGASTDIGKLNKPMRDRFGINITMNPYTLDELCTIVTQSASKLKLKINDAAIKSISKRCRGTPRIANHLLKRVRDYAEVSKKKSITSSVVDSAMKFEGIDKLGYNKQDYKYLQVLIENYRGTAGLTSLAITINTDTNTVKDNIEPYLMMSKIIIVTRRGRQITQKGQEFYQEFVKNEK